MLTDAQYTLLHRIKTHPQTNPFSYSFPASIIRDEDLLVYAELVALACVPKIRAGVSLSITPKGIDLLSEYVSSLEQRERSLADELRQRKAEEANAEYLQEVAQYHEKCLANRDASRSWLQFALSYILGNLSHLYDALKNLIH